MSDNVRSPQFESLFNDWNIPFQLEDSVTIESIRKDDKAQVRDIAHIAITDNVDSYALQMQAGREFPPVVVWDGTLIDGNTRLAAAAKIKRATFPVYRVQLPSIQMAIIVAAALNNIGGQRLTGVEARRSALVMMDQQFTDAQIAMYLGVTAESARQWRRLHEVDERAERTGIADLVGGLKKNQRMQLAKITQDRPFRDLAEAIAATSPQIVDVKDVAARAAAANSEEEAVGIISEARQEWTPIGPAPAKHRPNRAAQQARMHIGGLLKQDPADLVDPNRRGEDLARWHDLQIMAERVIALLAQQDAA